MKMKERKGHLNCRAAIYFVFVWGGGGSARSSSQGEAFSRRQVELRYVLKPVMFRALFLPLTIYKH